MMIKLGNFLFRYRNGLFPIAYLLLFCPSPQLFNDYALAAGLGLAIALLGQLVRAITVGLAYIKRGGKKRQVYAETLVQEGVFAHCRNPLYVGNFLILVGLGLIANSVLFMVVGVPFFIVAYLAIIAAEENYLRQKFGDEFDEYCTRVPRLFPVLSGLKQTLRSMGFNWQRLIVKEYGSAYAWMAGAILLMLKHHWLRQQEPTASGFVRAMLVCLVALSLLYGLARYFKKVQILRAD
ncbi:MAG TPA: isoprenylcysteine carboxylmethyltransferase family protein [Candidatus Binatia bacterium]|nr:isoprenylcysteine carboxylmethyltransferase family protein [Candidatus Binatia bacterium]